MQNKVQLRSKAKLLEPVIRIGKNGLSEGAVEEIKKQLKKKKLIKIKILKSALISQNRKELAKELSEKTNSEIIEQVGLIIVLNKKRGLHDK